VTDVKTEDVMDIEPALERAMEADDPGPAFAGRVVAAIKRDQAASLATGPVSDTGREGRSRVWRALLPLAATVALTGAGLQWWTVRVEDARAEGARVEDARARAAHAQLVQALQLTGEKLNVVHRAIERSQE
jgi:hypothetical protein